VRIALACALAAFMSSAAVADDSDLPHWNPGKATIAKLDFAFRNAGRWHGSPPPPSKYHYRYYAGVTVKGHRAVRAEFTFFPDSDSIAGKIDNPVHVVPEEKFPVIWDAGCDGVVNMLYDVDADRMIWIDC
jgi:hypothetical protein